MDTPTGTGTDLTALLDRWKTITRTATAGPWEAHSHLRQYSIWHDDLDEPLAREVRNWDDAVFMSAARTAMPLLLSAVEGVLKLHQGITDGDYPESRALCEEDGEDAPCPTVRAIRTALAGGDDADPGNPRAPEAATRKEGP